MIIFPADEYLIYFDVLGIIFVYNLYITKSYRVCHHYVKMILQYVFEIFLTVRFCKSRGRLWEKCNLVPWYTKSHAHINAKIYDNIPLVVKVVTYRHWYPQNSLIRCTCCTWYIVLEILASCDLMSIIFIERGNAIVKIKPRRPRLINSSLSLQSLKER